MVFLDNGNIRKINTGKSIITLGPLFFTSGPHREEPDGSRLPHPPACGPDGSGVVSIPDASQQKKPHPHPACHSGVECSRTIFWFSGVSLRGMPAQKTPSFASPAHARFAKVFSFAGCSRLLVLSYTVRDAKGVIRWRGADFSAWPPGPCTGIILPNLALSMQVSKWTQKRNLRLFLSKISHFL